MSSGVLQVFCACFGRSGACRTGPRACCSAWGRGLPCSPAAADPGERPRAGQGPGAARPAKPAPSGVLDAAGRDPIIGRRGTGGCAVVVAAGPMGSSGAGAPGCGHPSGWPAARGRGAWGWSARAAGSIRCGGRRVGRGQTRKRSRAARGRACSPGLVLCGGGVQRPEIGRASCRERVYGPV